MIHWCHLFMSDMMEYLHPIFVLSEREQFAGKARSVIDWYPQHCNLTTIINDQYHDFLFLLLNLQLFCIHNKLRIMFNEEIPQYTCIRVKLCKIYFDINWVLFLVCLNFTTIKMTYYLWSIVVCNRNDYYLKTLDGYNNNNNNIPNSNTSIIAWRPLYVFKNPVCSSCAPNNPMKLVIVIIPPKTKKNRDIVRLIVELMW